MAKDKPHSVPEWDLPDRLRKSLRCSKISVNDMADYLGVTRNSVGNWLAGRSKPSHAVLIAWAGKVDIDLAWLETGTTPLQESGKAATPDLVGVF